MTVQELRRILNELPDDMIIVCHRDEGGYMAFDVSATEDELDDAKDGAPKKVLYIGGCE